MPKEESFPIPMTYIDITRTTHTSLDVLSEKQIDDYRNVDEKENHQMHGQVSQDSFYRMKRPPDGYTWSGERLTRKQATSRPDNVWPDVRKHVSDALERKEK